MRTVCGSIAALLTILSVCADAADEFPKFETVTLDANVGKVCYAVTTADVDGDGLRDIVAVTENRVLWYQNPSWKMHVIIQDQTPLDNVCIAPLDIDGDGKIDFAIGAGWTKTGTLHWVSRGKSLDELWNVHSIGEEKSTHRMRWADVLGTGRQQLVISPLIASVGNGVRLTAFEIPANPKTDRWVPVVMDGQLNRMHNHWHVDFDGNKSVDTLTASQEGVHVVRRSADGFSRLKLASGAVADKPDQNGAGEIKMGKLSNGLQFITTVEPMHGNSLVVYTAPKSGGETAEWNRHVVDTGFQRGHALWTADINGDGNDEIAFGHSDTPDTFGVIVYNCPSGDGQTWLRHNIDVGGMATEDLLVEDMTGDGRLDIVAGGRSTHNLKLYVQRAK